jgi:two-component system OmpR family sensor kinase
MARTPASAWFLNGIRELPGRTPLRIKLITAVLALVAIALAVISVAGISVIRTYLLRQADTQLESLYLQAQAQSRFGHGYTNAVPGPDRWVYEGLTQQGAVLRIQGGNLPPGSAGPKVTAHAPWLTSDAQQFATVPAESGNAQWRVIAYPDFTLYQGPIQISATLIVGLDVTHVYATIGQLTSIDLLVSAIVILGVAVAGVAVVRASLRPLTEIEKTAEAIAAGDLTRRVPDRDPRTEVGRLGRSLNSMLAQIEAAFGARAESEYAARRSEDRMRQFVADASHELRTPLTAIRGFAEYYRQRGGLGEADGAAALPAAGNGMPPPAGSADAADDAGPRPAATTADRQAAAGPADRLRAPLARAELDRIMRRVEQESSRMGVLVEDMLLLARLDQQRPLDYRPVDLLTLAADAVHDARVVAPDRSIDLTVGAGAALIVLGDEVRLRQVIGNLMSNALTHTPEGTPIEIRVRSGSMAEHLMPAPGPAGQPDSAGQPGPGPDARPAPGPSSYQGPGPAPTPAVILEVADHGPGLTPDQAEHAFERFYRSDQARTRQAGGTGLGLAIVAALVTAHGGAVWVESSPGAGATFLIALPLAPEARDSEPESDEIARPDVAGARPGGLRPR